MSIFRKIYKLLIFPLRKLQYGSFGYNSDIVKPLLLKGKKYCYIGDRVFIRNMARIESIYDKEKSITPKLIIEDDVCIEQGVHLTCSGELSIGRGTTISSYVYISDTSHSMDVNYMSILKNGIVCNPTRIGEYVFIGTGAKILPGVRVGNNSIIGANAVVTSDIPDNCIAVGVPARAIKKYDEKSRKWQTIK